MGDYGSLVNVELSSTNVVVSNSGIIVVKSMDNSGKMGDASQQIPTYLNERTVSIIHKGLVSACDKQA